MENNNRKKRGLVLLGISLCLSLIGIKDSKAYEFNLKNEQPYDYNYHNNSELYPFYLGINLEDNKAVFQERGNAKFESTENYTKRNLTSMLKPYELNALYLTTNGNDASKDNMDKRLAMQLYIFENYAKGNHDTITFSFDTSKFHQISDELIKQGKEMILEKKYSYEIKQGKWTYFPIEWEGTYHILNDRNLDIREEDEGYYVKGDTLGTYTSEINIDKYKESGYYFDSNHYARSNYIEVTKPCTAHSTLEIKVVPPKFDIHYPSNQVGYDLDIQESSLKNEKVVYNLKVHDDYELKEFKITKKDGTVIKTTDNSFTMPNDDVYITIDVQKKTYNINLENTIGIILDAVSKANVGDKVTIKATPLDGYVLTHLYVNDEEISLDDLSFTMPNKDVSIKALSSEVYNINKSASNSQIDIQNKGLPGEKINFKVTLEDGYVLDKVMVRDDLGNDLEVKDNSFIMPKTNVTVSVITKKKVYNINTNSKNILVNVLKNAKKGDLVTFELKVNERYLIDKVRIITARGKEVSYKDNSFVMPNEDVTIIVDEVKLYKVSFIENGTNREISKTIYLKSGEKFDIPFFSNYDDVVVMRENGSYSSLINNNYTVTDNDLIVIYFTFDEEDLLDEDESYYFEEIPNTYESGFDPLFSLFAVSILVYLKKLLFN